MEDGFPMQRMINGEGEVIDTGAGQEITDDLAKSLYTKMLRARVFDRKCVHLQRQGRIGTYAPFEGQEAAQIGSAAALEDGDWMFPTYRDHGASMTFDMPLLNILLFWKGRFEGAVPPVGKNIFPPGVPIASQIPHAVGVAWAEKKKGTDRVSIAYFGDGATSEGDFHEGMNFASVFQVPVVLFNQNNEYALSVPLERQMHSKTIAQKALGYDMAGVRVDGNDVFAVYFETKKAVERARHGEGPTLIEAVTWRYGAHTTSDDPTKYRDNDVESELRRRTSDPLSQVEKYMKKQYWVDDQWVQGTQLKIDEEINRVVEELESYPEADIHHMFDYVFEKPTWTIAEQKEALLAYKGRHGE